MNWYIVQAYSGFEKKVVESLLDRARAQGLEDHFGEMLVPTEEVVEMRGRQKRLSKKRFFPGYMLIQMDMNEDAWHLVTRIQHVKKFVGGEKGRPYPIAQNEVDAILNRIQKGETRPRHKVVFEVGEMIRIIDGSFADLDAVVEDVNYSKRRLKVSVLIFGRSTSVDLEFSQVEKTHNT